jgi:hypothetical protein
MKHSSACPKVSLFDAMNWINTKGWWAAGLILLAGSIFIGVLGGKLYTPAICVIGAFTTFSIIFVAGSLFNLIGTKGGFWGTIAVGVIFGGLAAFLLYKTEKL